MLRATVDKAVLSPEGGGGGGGGGVEIHFVTFEV